ncbi:lipocalin-like [Archocentrus centrarchus]|uniref:lipocalin-like n=1 Tax=Archocentrus centrarchus TaxID=63155 RepID=UPI0011EA37A4|nr:lipocalin-like [Archocentrus centrarchus]
MASLLTLLGAVLCSLMVSSEVVPQADFDLQAMAGQWYLIGIASNAQWFVKGKDKMKMGTTMITPTADGGMELSFSGLSQNNTCRTMVNVANKTEVPGKFTYISRYWGYVSDLRMVDVKYDEYALSYSFNTMGNGTFVVDRLYGRDVELSDELKEKFRQFSLQTGILPENIVILPKNEECPPA